jgi:hypothetical protein
MFNTYLDHSLAFNCAANAPGARRLLLIRRDAISTMTYDAVGQVTGIASNGGWNEIKRPIELSIENNIRKSKAGTVQEIEVSFKLKRVSHSKNEYVERLSNTDMVAIVGDINGNYFVLGWPQALKIDKQSFTIGESNQYAISISTMQKGRVRQVTKACVNALAITSAVE